jgi:hypothetical protein
MRIGKTPKKLVRKKNGHLIPALRGKAFKL